MRRSKHGTDSAVINKGGYRSSGGPIGLHSGSSISTSFLIYDDFCRVSSIEIRIILNGIFLCVEIQSTAGAFLCTVFRLHCRLTKNWNLMQTMMNFVVLLAKHSCEHEQQPSFANVSDVFERVPRNLVEAVFSFPTRWVKDVSGPGSGASRLFLGLGPKASV